MRSFVLMALVLGCGESETGAPANDLSMMMMTNADLSASVDLSTFIDRGPTDLMTDFEPSGLFWDAPTQTLYISTSANQIIKWSDSGGFELVATVPFAFAAIGNNLSQLVRLSDGRIIVNVIGLNLNSSGMPTPVNGNILILDTSGHFSAVPKLNQKRQRQGLTVAADGTIYSGWFLGTGTGAPQGGVSKVDLSNGETDVWLGLQKVYGIAVDDTNLYAADQKQGMIFKLPLSSMDVDGGASSSLATVPAPDLMVLGGDLFTGGTQLSRVKLDGTVSTFYTPTRSTIRGVAFDSDHQRLFAAEPDAKFQDAGVMALLHILPVD
jgi:sugar lactone lactonase YvrE